MCGLSIADDAIGYSWHVADGISTLDVQDPIVSPTAPTLYIVDLVNACGPLTDSDEDAADAIQKPFWRHGAACPKLEAPRYCKTWLTRVLIYNCYDILRRKKRETPVEFLPEQAAEEQGGSGMDVKRTAAEAFAEHDRLVADVLFHTSMTCLSNRLLVRWT